MTGVCTDQPERAGTKESGDDGFLPSALFLCRVSDDAPTVPRWCYSGATMTTDHHDQKDHRFGGDWTTAKLTVLARYLTGYTTALKDKPTRERPFRKAYIDAFAGTGYRTVETGGQPGLLFPDLAATEPQSLLEGSATLALRTAPPFDKYIFIERKLKRCEQLESLKTEFPDLARAIEIRQGDANLEIQNLCSKDWRFSSGGVVS